MLTVDNVKPTESFSVGFLLAAIVLVAVVALIVLVIIVAVLLILLIVLILLIAVLVLHESNLRYFITVIPYL